MNPHPFRIVVNNVVVFHHLYLGLLLVGWSFPFDFIGGWIALDDVYEHLIDYNSPLRLLFDRYISPKLD